MNEALRLLALLSVVSTLPLGFALLSGVVSPDGVVALAFSTALALVWLTREGTVPARARPAYALGVLAGVISYPFWAAVIVRTGLAIGLAPAEPTQSVATPIGIAAVLLIAPLYEELLYRERLLCWLRRVRVPIAARIVVSATLFSVPHVDPWSVLGTAIVGCGLAATYEFTRSVGSCVALHVGLNASSVLGIVREGGLLA